MKTISIIVPSYNSCRTIGRTLESLRPRLSEEKILELIVVDSSDDRQTRVLLKNYEKLEKIKIVLLEQKAIPALARNIGFEHATGDLLCFIDSDVYVADDWFKNVGRAYNNGCLAGGGSIAVAEFQENDPIAWAQCFLQFNEYLPVGNVRSIAMLPAANFFCDRKIFAKVQGFPLIRAAEDVRLCLRLREIVSVWFVPQARGFHIFRADRKSYERNQFLLGTHIILYRRQEYRSWYYKGIFPVLLLPVFVALKYFGMAKRILSAGPETFVRFLRVMPLFLWGLLFWTLGFLRGCFILTRPPATAPVENENEICILRK